MSEYEISNRYGEIVFDFFGKPDDHKQQLENNVGAVVFNIESNVAFVVKNIIAVEIIVLWLTKKA